ncbi:integrase, catalytic region, zinc finger, CCHC-type containing protein [Tanacetum coccineum]
MPYSTYMKFTDERPAKSNIRLSLASHSYIYPLGIAEDMLVEVAKHVYPVDFVILDIKENENRPFILGTPFLITAKASIKFDKGTITLRSRKSKEYKKQKKVKDYTYHKEKMLLCKQAEKDVPLQAEQADWLEDTDEEIDKQELEAHYSYMAKIQEVPTADSGTDTEPLETVQYDVEYNVFSNERQHSEQPESINNTCVVEKVDSNVIPNSLDMCNNDISTDQNAKECDDERVALAYLIANLKLDVDENKKIQKQLKKANASLTQELNECKSILMETSRTLGESNSTRDSLRLVKEKHDELVKHSFLTKSHYEGLVKEKTKISYDTSDPANRFVPDKEEILTLEKESRLKLNKDLVKPYDYKKQNSHHENFKPASKEHHDQLAHANEYFESLEKEIDKLESDKAEFSNMYVILLQECVSQDVIYSYLHSLSDLDAHTELQCLYPHKVKECKCLAQKLSKQTKTVSKEIDNEFSQSFAKLEKNSISLELALKQCQEQMKNDTICKKKASNVFLKEREQYFKIQDLKAQLQDKNIAISELKKLIEKCKGKSVET